MPEIDPRNSAFSWSTLFVRTLFEHGIEHLVISPGSRSTPLTLAFASHPGFNNHIIIDERSAAFTALGIGKASAKPAVLVCTSGTAVANYLPAVIEAKQSGVPLIIASADRPPRYRNLGASQTIDQLKLFGNYTAFFHETGEPDHSSGSRARLQLAAKQAVQLATDQEGVSHLNFAFRKPFEPETDYLNKVRLENQKHANRIFSVYEKEVGKIRLDETFWSDLVSAERPLIIVGPTSPGDATSFISDLAEVLGAPLLAEPGSNIPASPKTIEGFDGFLRNKTNRELLNPDLILRFGQQPVSKALNKLLEEADSAMQICFMNPNRWTDGSLSSDKQISLNAPLHIPEVTGSASPEWIQSWEQAEIAFTNFRSTQLETAPPLTDGIVFSELSPLIPENAFTMLSNSFPVRDLSLFGTFNDKKIYVNRGAAGIDGITSTAIGLSIAEDRPGVLFVGDIAFLHDSNALLNAALVTQPLIVVILNNGGGTIFRMLPVHSVKDHYETYFETPQQASISALCRAHKVHHTLISKQDQLQEVFEERLSQNGLSVLECMTDADDSMILRNQLWNFSLGEQE
ncbi:MAG: 2-succinyl-5-enolpyruvyl-6-hydroxy-3-cyclohexene-1-carboxylic-acid synthase [Balneolaceae bacterium]|nr:2-succinyl-5-enolpyruvyl-6-hydroxy-3-cyclohexene-1-carboxylic-acid synthase [Balneolaceae bacterium]